MLYSSLCLHSDPFVNEKDFRADPHFYSWLQVPIYQPTKERQVLHRIKNDHQVRAWKESPIKTVVGCY